MGSVIENAKTKEKCQIFTPDDIVETMLDHVGYIDSLYGKTILENSCGNGQFLKGIVKRYINDCKRKGLSRTKIKNGLGRDIFGIELDPSLYRECIQTLNSITDSFGLKRVCWQIKQADALREPYSLTFDFVVGNPPYVSYWDLEKSEREYIEGKYTTCQYGAWDYSYAFLQDGFNHLNSAGKMAYIIPNSIFKTKSGRSIRTLLQPYLTEVLDFTTTNVFEKVLTSPAIIIIDRSTRTEQIVYKDLSANLESTVNRETLNDEWLFGCQEQAPGLQHKFGDYFRVATSIATQCNSVYVLTNYSDDGEYLICEGSKIEKSVVRKAASPKGKANDTTEYIIFPYYYSDGILKHYDEVTFKQKFPFAYACPWCNRAKWDIWPSDNSKINVVDSEGFIDPCTEEYDKHLIRLPDGSISGITPLGKYMRKTLQLYLKRHEIIHNLDKLKRKRDELKNSVAKDKLQGKECRKKEAALQLITESFFEYFNLWEKISQESA